MGTDIVDLKGLKIKRFYGGDHRGTCYQVNADSVQLTQADFNAVVETLKEHVRKAQEHYFNVECYDAAGKRFVLQLLSSKEPKVLGESE